MPHPKIVGLLDQRLRVDRQIRPEDCVAKLEHLHHLAPLEFDNGQSNFVPDTQLRIIYWSSLGAIETQSAPVLRSETGWLEM